MATREQTTAPPTAPVNGSVVSISLPTDTREVTSGKPSEEEMIALETKSLNMYYSDYLALEDISLQLAAKKIIAIIGPSGCGKSTLLRVFNRMNELIPGVRIEGQVLFNGQDLYAPSVDATEVRFRIGMVFQKPNPFPKSIYDNVAFGPRLAGVRKSALDDIIEGSLTRAALWEEVKDRLKSPAYGLSGGQQQRLCIARAIAVEPDVVLMDEPCSALDPIATGRIEELIAELKTDYTIVIVTHNMQQAARISDMTAFFSVQLNERGTRTGELVEVAPTSHIFTNPDDKRTEAYITGRVG